MIPRRLMFVGKKPWAGWSVPCNQVPLYKTHQINMAARQGKRQ
jgi:hypothetical protein